MSALTYTCHSLLDNIQIFYFSGPASVNINHVKGQEEFKLELSRAENEVYQVKIMRRWSGRGLPWKNTNRKMTQTEFISHNSAWENLVPANKAKKWPSWEVRRYLQFSDCENTSCLSVSQWRGGSVRYKTHGERSTLHGTNYDNWSGSRELSPWEFISPLPSFHCSRWIVIILCQVWHPRVNW